MGRPLTAKLIVRIDAQVACAATGDENLTAEDAENAEIIISSAPSELSAVKLNQGDAP
jgi:hypothetical protein